MFLTKLTSLMINQLTGQIM